MSSIDNIELIRDIRKRGLKSGDKISTHPPEKQRKIFQKVLKTWKVSLRKAGVNLVINEQKGSRLDTINSMRESGLLFGEIAARMNNKNLFMLNGKEWSRENVRDFYKAQNNFK